MPGLVLRHDLDVDTTVLTRRGDRPVDRPTLAALQAAVGNQAVASLMVARKAGGACGCSGPCCDGAASLLETEETPLIMRKAVQPASSVRSDPAHGVVVHRNRQRQTSPPSSEAGVTLCEDPSEIAEGGAPALLEASGATGPVETTGQLVTASQFQLLTGVSADRLPADSFVGRERLADLRQPLAQEAAGGATRGVGAAAAVAAATAPVPMTFVPPNSIGLLWAEGHLSIFAKVDGQLVVRGFRGNQLWYIGEMLPGPPGRWFTEQLVRGVEGQMRGDRLFTLMGKQSVIYLETDAATAGDFGRRLRAAQYRMQYRYSPPRPDAAGATERAMHQRVYQARGAPRAVLCTQNCTTVPFAEIERILGMRPSVGGVDVVTGRTASGTIDPHLQGRAALMREWMRKPDLSGGRPGLRSGQITPAASNAIGVMRVGGGVMLIYAGYNTGQRLLEAWGGDDFALVATQEAMTWGAGIAGGALGTAAASALVCAPAGPVTLACAVAGFLGGAIVGGLAAAGTSLILPALIRVAESVNEAIATIARAIRTTHDVVRGFSQAFARDLVFRPLLTSRHALNPCNWELQRLSARTQADVMALGLHLWAHFGRANPDQFFALMSRPVASFAVPRELLRSIAAGVTQTVRSGSPWDIVFTAEFVGGLGPIELVRQLRAYGLLQHSYEPELLADIELAG